MNGSDIRLCTAFDGNRNIASGSLLQVSTKVKGMIDNDEVGSVLIFEDSSSELVEIDFRGELEEVLKSVVKHAGTAASTIISVHNESGVQRAPGRPKLGVIPREVTLLPRHWDWLNSQPGGASVALRKLVEEARRLRSDIDKVRYSKEVTYRFMHAMAGNFSGFEEATRALFAGNSEKFNEIVALWPDDIGQHVYKLSGNAFAQI